MLLFLSLTGPTLYHSISWKARTIRQHSLGSIQAPSAMASITFWAVSDGSVLQHSQTHFGVMCLWPTGLVLLICSLSML